MSLRFSLYALDLSGFDGLLQKSLADILCGYAEKGTQEEPGLCFHEAGMKEGNRCYYARPRRVFVWDTTRRTGDQVLNHDLREEELRDIPYLRRTLLDHLKSADMAELWTVCDAFSEWNAARFVERLLGGYKWGPPEALIRVASEAFGKDHPRLIRLVSLFQKVYRRFATDQPFRGRLYELSEFGFPVKPREDCDVWLSVWTAEEARFLVETLDLIDREESSRSRNLYLDTTPPEDQGEDYFRDMIKSLLRIRDIGFEQLTVVGFVKC